MSKKNTSNENATLTLDFYDNNNKQNISETELEKFIVSLKPNKSNKKATKSDKKTTKSKKNNKDLVETTEITETSEPTKKEIATETEKIQDEIKISEPVKTVDESEENIKNFTNSRSKKDPEKAIRSRNYDESVNQLHIYHRNQKDVKVPKVQSLIEQLQNLVPTGRFKIQTEEVKRAKEAKKAERAARREEKEKQALRAKSEKITAELDGRILPKAPPKVPKKREKKDKDKDKEKK